MANKYLGRDILGKKLGKTQSVDIEEWGGSVLIRQISERELYDVRKLANDAVKDGEVADNEALWHFNFELIRACWIDNEEDRNPVLTPEDEAALMEESHAALETLVEAISVLNNLGEQPVASAEKNLEATRNGASGTD